jgi:hypothetical protein
MNLIALVTGLVLAAYAIFRFRVTRLEKKRWLYSLLLATFPFYYFAFAIYANDHDALIQELYVGLAFLAFAFIAYKLRSTIGVAMLAAVYIGHAVYDVVHNRMFINEGTPVWWPEFCGAVDGLMGLYLVYLAVSLNTNKKYA